MPVASSPVEAQFAEAREAWKVFRRKNPSALLIQLHREQDGRVYIIAHHPAAEDPQLTMDAAALADHYRAEGLI